MVASKLLAWRRVRAAPSFPAGALIEPPAGSLLLVLLLQAAASLFGQPFFFQLSSICIHSIHFPLLTLLLTFTRLTLFHKSCWHFCCLFLLLLLKHSDLWSSPCCVQEQDWTLLRSSQLRVSLPDQKSCGVPRAICQLFEGGAALTAGYGSGLRWHQGIIPTSCHGEGSRGSPVLQGPFRPAVPSCSKLRHIIDEMVTTEREYVRSLCYIIESYFPEMERLDLPQDLRGKRSVIFGNLEKLYDFHSQYFLRELESCCNHPLRVSHCFLRHVRRHTSSWGRAPPHLVSVHLLA